MKLAISFLAMFLSISTAAQQSGFPIKNELPSNKPVKFELHKKSISTKPIYVNNNVKEAVTFSFYTPDFKTLQDNLSVDKQFFQLQQKKKEWTDFSSGLLHSYSSAYTRQSWNENRNNVQQRWMTQKLKGK